MKAIPKKKNKFLTFLRSLCSPNIVQQKQTPKQKQKKKCKPQKIHKTPRLTFHLDRVLVKLSRKNVIEQQFMQNQVLTFHLQKHIGNRLKQCDIIVFCGQFSNFLTEKFTFSIQLKPNIEQAYEKQNNYILANQKAHIKFRKSGVDAMVVQLYFGEKQTSQENSQKSQNTNKTSVNTNQTSKKQQISVQLDKMQQIIRSYHKKVDKFIFICHRDLKLQDIHNLFLVFKENYLFELERIKKVQKLVCNIIYISTQSKFLKIDNNSLSEFIITQLSTLKAFQNQENTFVNNRKLNQDFQNQIGLSKQIHNQQSFTDKSKKDYITMKNNKRQFLNKSSAQKNNKQITKIIKSQQLLDNQQANKPQKTQFNQLQKITALNDNQPSALPKTLLNQLQFQQLILNLLQLNLHIHLTQILAYLLDSKLKYNVLQHFLKLLHEKCPPNARNIIQKYKKLKTQQNNIDRQFVQSVEQYTPVFQIKPLESKNFSKITALFQTHDSQDQGDYILCNQNQNYD